jgi:cytoskeletal protein CcmA (bactofilin family)
MFKRNARNGSHINSIFGKGSSINGNIIVEGSLRIDGEFVGEIQASDSLTVGKDASVRADIRVDAAYIAGKVVGNVFAGTRVELKRNAAFSGNIYTPNLVIDEGATFEGNCQMNAQNPLLTFRKDVNDTGEKEEITLNDDEIGLIADSQ